MILTALRIAAALSLLVLPGAWLAFALPVRQFSFSSRLGLSGVLSPVIVALEFYIVRLAGLSYSQAIPVLVVLNLASLWFVVREWRSYAAAHDSRLRWPGAKNVAVFLLLVACISVPWSINPTLRMFKFHAWMHLSIVNQFPAGALVPEEPEMAGYRLAYPWLGHIYWAVVSSAGSLPFTKVYILTNLAFLGWTCIFVYEACRLLGASAAGARAALLWLALGTNVVGFWIWKFTGWLPGDIRYTPWIRKFVICELSAFVLGLLAALMLVGLAALQTRSRTLFATANILTVSVGLLYAVLLPAAAGFCGALAAVLLLDPRLGDRSARRRDAIWLLVGLFVAVLASFAFVKFVSVARTAPAVTFPGVGPTVTKVGTGLIAILAFIPAMALVIRKRGWPPSAILLLVAATISFGLRALFHIGGAYNEYKLMLPTALFLIPLASLALLDWKSRRISCDWLVVASALVLAPTITAMDYRWQLKLDLAAPQVEESGLGLALKPGEPDAGWISAVLAGTSPDTILAVRRSDTFLPALVGRSLLAPPDESQPPPGYWELSRFNLVDVRGYSGQAVDRRGALLFGIFSSGDNATFENVYQGIVNLNRPLAIRFAPGDGQAFLAWLRVQRRGKLLYQDSSGVLVWLINP